MTTPRVLPNKPLVEAILEVRWALHSAPDGPPVDPHYKILVGRLFDRFQPTYPSHEQLPTAMMPDELVPYIPQHRFRASEGQWPLVQVGPGVLTVNETTAYTWPDFKNRAIKAVETLFGVHPGGQDFRLTSASLRYIDAVALPDDSDPLAFIGAKLKTQLQLPAALFASGRVTEQAKGLDVRVAMPCNAPQGQIALQFRSGQREEKPAVIWEVALQSLGADVPKDVTAFQAWLQSAHELLDEWFFSLIEGDLLAEFSKGE